VKTNKHRILGLAILAILITAGPIAAQSTESVTQDPALYAVGALGASNLYTSYFLLGTLADGYATAAYTAQFADELTRDVIGLNESSIDVLEQLLAESSLAGADKGLVQDMITAHRLLIDQAWGLLAYVEDSSNTEAWFRYRRQAWDLISVLLDIN
jgi:hypothetical protein